MRLLAEGRPRRAIAHGPEKRNCNMTNGDNERHPPHCRSQNVNPLLEFRVQTVESMVDALGARLSMLEGIVFAIRRQAPRLEGGIPGRNALPVSESLAPSLKRGTA